MRTATVGEIQKNFSAILKRIKGGEEIVVTRRGKPVAKIIAMGPRDSIDWPDFHEEAISLRGKPLGEIVHEGRDLLNQFGQGRCPISFEWTEVGIDAVVVHYAVVVDFFPNDKALASL